MATPKDSSALHLFDEITRGLANLRGTIGVCRIAAAAQAIGGVEGLVLNDADLPDALDAAVAMVESINERTEQLYDAMKAARSITAVRTETSR